MLKRNFLYIVAATYKKYRRAIPPPALVFMLIIKISLDFYTYICGREIDKKKNFIYVQI